MQINMKSITKVSVSLKNSLIILIWTILRTYYIPDRNIIIIY